MMVTAISIRMLMQVPRGRTPVFLLFYGVLGLVGVRVLLEVLLQGLIRRELCGKPGRHTVNQKSVFKSFYWGSHHFLLK
jgi:hypothetical protein